MNDLSESDDAAQNPALHALRARLERDRLCAGLGALHQRFRGSKVRGIRAERGHRPDFHWGMALYAGLVAGRWCWYATTSGGETVRVTGALLDGRHARTGATWPLRLKDTPMWRQGAPAGVSIIEDATGTLDADSPATHLRITSLVRDAVDPRTVDSVVSLHVADPDARAMYYYSAHRPEGWPP